MKYLLSVLALSFLFFGFNTQDVLAGSINITNPDSGDEYYLGEEIDIRWGI